MHPPIFNPRQRREVHAKKKAAVQTVPGNGRRSLLPVGGSRGTGRQGLGCARRKARTDLQGFWARRAKELEWFQKWDKVLDDSNKPFFKWFVGAKTNIVHNAIDRHLKTHRKNKLALIWESEDGKIDRTSPIIAMNREVSAWRTSSKPWACSKGDRVTIYMGRVPEIVFAMLACAKIGAIHSVVFGGFSVDSLQGRIDDSQSKLVITCDGSYQERQDRRAEEHRGRSPQALPHRGECDRRQAHRPTPSPWKRDATTGITICARCPSPTANAPPK